MLEKEDFLNLMPTVIRHYSHPYLYHPNSIPFYKVSQLVKQNQIKAVLSGEGADECYIGYDWLVPSISARIKNSLRGTFLYSIKKMLDQLRGINHGRGFESEQISE